MLYYIKRISLGLVLFLFIAVSALAIWFNLFALNAADGERAQRVTVLIPKGSSVEDINGLLAEQNLVKKDIRFLLLAKYLGVATKLQAGEFALHRGQTPKELLLELSQAKPIQHPVTIPEGLVIDDIARIFGRGGWCDATRFSSLARDQQFMQELGIAEGNSLEGYLYPDTYYLTRKGFDAEGLIRMQIKRFFEVWKKLPFTEGSELSSREVLILASMVEKEAGVVSELPVIASVFHNRLQKGMRLQSDPTVMYGIPNFTGRLTKSNLRSPTPYNTYTLPRLPAGPICNPGEGALRAVLSPAKTEYYYFVSKGNRQHYFSKTLREHNRAVYKYLRKPRKKR